MSTIKVKTTIFHRPTPAGTDILVCSFYNANTLALEDFRVLDVSGVDGTTEVTFVFDSSSWSSTFNVYVGIHLQSGSGTNMLYYTHDNNNLEGCVLGTGRIRFDPLELLIADDPWIQVYKDDSLVAKSGGSSGDEPDYHFGLDQNSAHAIELPPFLISKDPSPDEVVLPNKAVLPVPADNSNSFPSLGLLLWSSGGLTSNYNVYFGPTGNMTLVSYAQQSTNYSGLSLSALTDYQWRIDSINSNGRTTGKPWSFTTYADLVPPRVSTDGEDGEGNPTGVNNMVTLKRIVVAAANKIWTET